MDVRIKMGDSRSKSSGDIGLAHFATNDDDVRRSSHKASQYGVLPKNVILAFCLSRSLTTGWARQNAALLKFVPKLSETAFSVVFTTASSFVVSQ